jgi:ADP-ribosylglycohydrolase
MAISIVEELGCSGEVDQDGLAKRFAARHAAEPHRGYGGMAHRILMAIDSGASWSDVSPKAFDGQGSMGNGGAMRVGPVGAYFADDYDAVVENARRSAEVTHAHPDGQAGAIAIAVAAAFVSRAGANAGPEMAEEMFATVLERTPDGLTRTGIVRAAELSLDFDVSTVIHAVGNGSQIVSYDTVPFTLWCAARHMGSYEDALWTTVLGLGDVDTTAAIVGGIVINGRSEGAIPQEWIESREALPI